MVATGAYGAKLASRFGMARAPTLVTRGLPHGDFAVTEIRCDRQDNGLTGPIPREDALLVTLQLRDCPAHELWFDGKAAPTTRLAAGVTSLYDLRTDPIVNSISPFHNLHFYAPRMALARVAEVDGGRLAGGLRHDPGRGVDDPVLRGLGLSLLPALSRPSRANPLFVSHVTLSIAAHLAGLLGVRGAADLRLSPAQTSRACELIAATGLGDLSIETVAEACGVPPAGFAQAFREATGALPHRWQMERRLEEARALLATGLSSVEDIAATCGFTGPRHLRRALGLTP